MAKTRYLDTDLQIRLMTDTDYENMSAFVTLIGYMQDNGLKRADLAARLGVSPQYVSKLLSGTENLSFKSVANIEDKLGITCFAMT